LLGVEVDLQRTMLPLTFVQTLFKATSAPLGMEVQQMFTSLTQEIEGLHGKVREIFGTKFKQLDQTRQGIGQVVAHLTTLARTLREVTTTHKARIELSLNNLKHELSANQERDIRLTRMSQDFAREVGEMVVGLQFQDIVNQKLQHVTAALPHIEGKFEGYEAAPRSAAGREALQFLNQSCRLEAEQLQVAQVEMAKAELGIQASLQRVLSHLNEMDSKCLSLEEFKLLTTSFDGMVQVLVETIEEVRELVGTTVAGATQAYQLLHPLGSMASDLTAVVRSVSAQIRLIGLNAQVQAALAARDRRGAGLEVLSARTSEISEETNHISTQAASQLDALAAGLAQSVKAFEQLRIDGLAMQAILNEQGRAEEQHLHAFRDQALDSVRSIGSSLDNIRQRADKTLASLQLASFHQVTLPALRAPMLGIAETAEHLLLASGHGLAKVNLMENFKRRYTMASEHKAFSRIVPQSPPAEAPALTASARPGLSSEPSDPLAAGENEEAPSLAGAASDPSGGHGLGSNVELF
jgi:hypothetical protein